MEKQESCESKKENDSSISRACVRCIRVIHFIDSFVSCVIHFPATSTREGIMTGSW